ncbi:hypothetical protein PVAND_012093 [Polypedilum vanderplanki]|uniref:1-acyl-sn-glycerol-3-phosphate acyltransferase n=1 Tax=Polypedilum vanderplanki TaxID=319348 RepID=A0A9J6CLD0_POLVA|nr:hypothetical protein PVAND_012093 [Polypedilum vanderplanki]
MAALYIPYFAIRGKTVENILIYAETIKHLTRVLGITWTLRGAESLMENKSFIIIANHQTSVDIMGMFNIWHVIQSMTVIAKKELLYAGPFGIAAYLSGLIFIDRHSSKGKETMNQAMEVLKKNNTKLWIFPEGTRRNTGEIHNFKKGAFHTAIQYEIPIIPIVFSSYRHFLDDKNKKFDEGEIILTVLPTIKTKGLKLSDIDELMEKTKKEMTLVYKKISDEAAENLKQSKNKL